MSSLSGHFLKGFTKCRKARILKRTNGILKICHWAERNRMESIIKGDVYDVIVIGAGIEGSSIAYSLAKQGQRTLLLEQFPLPHSRGSSHGQSRITRYSYADSFYIQMMVDAFPMWAQLEVESKRRLFVNCGLINFHFNHSVELERMADALQAYSVPHAILTSAEVQRRFPQMKNAEDCRALWDPQGGLLKADKCLKAFQDVFERLGGVIRDEEAVLEIAPGELVAVSTPRARHLARNVVVAAGPWSDKLCRSLGLTVYLQPVRALVLYWKVDQAFVHLYQPERFPCFIDSRTQGDSHLYGFPSHEYPGMVKICFNPEVVIDPDDRDNLEDDSSMTEEVKERVALTFGHLASTPSIREYCIYTNTPDKHPYIDRHPEYSNIVVAAGFSGHGFKLAPAVGKAVTELILKDPLTYNMEPFKLNRFAPKASL